MSTKKQSRFVTDLLVTLVVGLFLVSACSPAVATPNPHGDPLAPTAEVFNPLDPSPTPASGDLPLTCQVTDLNVQVDRELGYCFAYPKRFTVGTSPMLEIPAEQGPAIGSSALLRDLTAARLSRRGYHRLPFKHPGSPSGAAGRVGGTSCKDRDVTPPSHRSRSILP